MDSSNAGRTHRQRWDPTFSSGFLKLHRVLAGKNEHHLFLPMYLST